MITDEQILKEWNLVKRCENCTNKGATTTTYTGDGPRHECWCHITGNPGPLHDLYKTRECCSKWELSKWIRDSYLKKHPAGGGIKPGKNFKIPQQEKKDIMATNYMTVAEAEIGDLEARLWRIKQAIEIKDPNFITNRIDDELMKMRFENNEDRRLMATHPAKYTDSFIPIFAKLLMDCKTVLDPFGGTGKLNKIKAFGFSGEIICNEIEPDFAKLEDKDCICFVDKWNIGDAEKMDFLNDESVDAICTSPTYGNRMADHFKTTSNRKYMTYTHCIGHDLNEGNTGKMQFGNAYMDKHMRIYRECNRVLKKGGKFICNVSNFIRGGVEVDVVSFHKKALENNGFCFVKTLSIPTRRMGFGQNREHRVQHEEIMVFEKL